LVTALSERIETTRREADEVLTSIVDLITATVAAGEDVAISGFAKFRRVDRPARMGRNPATGETIRIKAKRSAKITPLKNFKDAVLSGKGPAPAKKAAAKKTTAKKTTAKKAPARKTAAKKAPARKAPARKAAKKAPARKAAKKTTRR
jgi:DNA-binding protein HU-beta